MSASNVNIDLCGYNNFDDIPQDTILAVIKAVIDPSLIGTAVEGFEILLESATFDEDRVETFRFEDTEASDGNLLAETGDFLVQESNVTEVTTQPLVAQDTGTPIGNMTAGGGLAAAFDGDIENYNAGAQSNATSGNIGKDFGLTHCGAHTMDTMRMESGFLHWGHDISPEENQYQAGLNFAISYKKPFDFIGKEKLLKIRDQKLDIRFVMLALKESKPGEPLLLHEEPIYLDDKIIGKTTSGNYSFNYDKNLSFGYINCDFSNDQLFDKNLYIELEKKKYPAELLTQPLKANTFKNI